MSITSFLRRRWLCVLVLILASPAGAAVRLPGLIADHMVLQRDRPVTIWGWADPHEAVAVRFADQAVDTTADDQGRWHVTLEPMPASSEPRTMQVIASNTLEVADVLVGEVWLCTGQSNMEWPLQRARDAEAEIAAANYPGIRRFSVRRARGEEPLTDVGGQWASVFPESIDNFSAVGYFFGRRLHKELGIPIGLIESDWGGTPAEAWTSREALESSPALASTLAYWERRIERYPEALAAWEKEMERLRQEQGIENVPERWTDEGMTDAESAYTATDFDDSDWSTATLPGAWDAAGDPFDGVVWYRKTVALPSDLQGKPLTLSLGAIDDADRTYVDGKLVGSTDQWEQPRQYEVPADATSDGELVIAVRVFDGYLDGGFRGAAQDMQLTAGEQTAPLAGEWKMHVERRLSPAGVTLENPPRKPAGPDDRHRPAILFNGMIAPLTPMTVRGAIWYQGESNAGRHDMYRELLPLMIRDWRSRFGEDLAFGIVQLTSYKPTEEQPSDPTWAHIRDAQLQTSRNLPNAGLAVTIDVGEVESIHPANKQDVGYRLAQWALADVYGQDIVAGGPLPTEHRIEDGSVFVDFEQVGDGLEIRGDGPLSEFALAGEDKQWHWAQAEIVDKDTVRIWSDAVPHPVAARYAWSNTPANPNLVNSENLPATPFRTDDWPSE